MNIKPRATKKTSTNFTAYMTSRMRTITKIIWKADGENLKRIQLQPS